MSSMTSVIVAALFFTSSKFLVSADAEVNECTMTDSTDCALSTLTGTTAVYTGNNTRCYFDTKEDGTEGNPYFFQVTPGTGDSSNNLIIYFQGGGACMSEEDCTKGGARRSPSVLYPPQGIFEERGDNKFAGWTAVKILYCTGDVHIGNGVDGDTYFNGRNNVKAVIEWMTLNLVDETPERVVIVGTSAGSIGLHVWANRMLQFVQEQFDQMPVSTVVMDSSVGNDSSEFTVAVKETWGDACSAEALADFGFDAATSGLCGGDGSVPASLVDFQNAAQAAWPTVPFVFVVSKQDTTGLKNFCQAAIAAGDSPCFQSDYYNFLKDTFRSYHDTRGTNNNVLTYLINRSMHVAVTNQAFYFPSSTAFAITNPDSWFHDKLNVWLASVALRGDTYNIQSQCGPWFALLPPWPFTDLFCDCEISQKRFKSS